MTHRRKQRQVLENVELLELAQGPVPIGTRGTPGSLILLKQEFPLVTTQILDIPSTSPVSITITDTGGANGGFGNKSLITLPPRKIVLLGMHMNLAFTAAAGILATGTVNLALGSAAETTDSTLNAAQADILASSSAVLVASAGALVSAGGFSNGFINASSGTVQVFLNVGIPDASITSNSSLIISGMVKMSYLDLGV